MLSILIAPLLVYCVYMLAVTWVSDSIAVFLYAPLVIILTNALCKATNWMDKETENEDT
jgi:hypothetical protein